MAEQDSGGKSAVAPPAIAPTGGMADSPAAGQAAAPETAGVEREGFIPRERFDEVHEEAASAKARVAELEAEVGKSRQAASPAGRPASWEQVPEETLKQVLGNPIQYAEHFGLALAEHDRRLEARLGARTDEALTVADVKRSVPGAFDDKTPLGREVKRIMASNRSQADILKDVIDLATLRSGAPGKTASEDRKKLTDNLRTALNQPSAGASNLPAPAVSYLDMPSEEFEKVKQEVLLGKRRM